MCFLKFDQHPIAKPSMANVQKVRKCVNMSEMTELFGESWSGSTLIDNRSRKRVLIGGI